MSGALNFDTPDCRVTGSCDLYTTKAAGTDKKLYKNINQSLETQHAALVKFGESLSSPHRDSVAASLNLRRSSPFGNLSEVSSRRTYAYLIATLNASHPDYDFSHVLRPADFKREKVLRRVMNNMDSTLSSIRPNSNFLDVALPRNSPGASSSYSYSSNAGAAPSWGPQMWAMMDEEMTLKDCTVFSYQPQEDPFDEEEGAIWALHYFFFNKTRKRVCYLYVRGTPVMSHSPRVRPGVGRSSDISAKRSLSSSDVGATKRARYWLGDRVADRITNSDDEMEDDDGLVWNRESNDGIDYEDDEDDDDFLASDDAEDELSEAGEDGRADSPRGVSEDVADRMEMEV